MKAENEGRPGMESRAGTDETTGKEDSAVQPDGQGEIEEISGDDLGVGDTVAHQNRDIIDNLDDFRLDQDFDPNEIEDGTPIVIGKPPKDDYFRVHPDPKMTTTAGIYETSDREVYLVKKNMQGMFSELISVRQIFVCVTARGKRFLWPAKLPRAGGGGGGGEKYNSTGLKAAEAAKTRWTRMYSDQTMKLYRFKHPVEPPPEPDWSSFPSLLELINAAFGDGYVIASPQHPEARRLR
jgi:hypothetical protein